MTSANPSESSAPTPLERLKDASDLAYLLYRRNKNQHRRSHWWKHFSTFRRQLSHLVSEISAVKQKSVAGPAKEGSTDALLLDGKAEARVNFWVEEHRVDKWFAAFSQVVCERRFVALGLTLLGLLARVCHIVGAIEKLEERSEEASQMVEQLQLRSSPRPLAERRGEDLHDDVGVVISRENVSASVAVTENVAQPVKTMNKRRRTNAIDNIFGDV